jgi:hypothetical protein
MRIWQPFTNPQAGGPVTVLLTYQGSSLSQATNWQDIFRVAVILHELGHATGAWDDAGWSAQQYANNLNSILETACDEHTPTRSGATTPAW